MKPLIRLLRYHWLGSALAPYLIKWLGKAPHPIHPKHLNAPPEHFWFIDSVGGDDTVLDVGCGTGAHALRCASAAKRVVGLERSRKEISIARAQALSTGGDNVKLVVADAETGWPFASESFSRVLLLDILEHLERRREALKEARRVLRPDGLLFLSVPNSETRWKRRQKQAGLPYYSDVDHKVEYSEERLLHTLGDVGFEVIGPIRPVTYDTPLAGLIDLLGAFSLRLYRRLSAWKREVALRNPRESIGFRVVCQKRPS